MEAIFDSLGKSIYNADGHKGYMIQWRFISPFCRKWSGNRDPDAKRVTEMLEYHRQGGYMPKLIHLAEIEDEGMVCYDGNHRKEVYNACKDEDISCIVDVMFNTTKYEVYRSFNNINKSVQVPAIYTESLVQANNVRAEIIKLVITYERRYKPYLSASPGYRAPNFNRDNFTDNVYDIYKAFNGTISIEKLGELLEKLNFEYSSERICRPHIVYNSYILGKCKKYGLWLFIEKIIPIEHIERIII